MNTFSLAVFLMIVAIAVIPFLIIHQLAGLAHSVYRNRLWTLRDRITDDLRRGAISRSPAAEKIRRFIEEQVHVAGRHSLIDSILAIMLFEVNGNSSVFEDILKAGVPESEKEVLKTYLRDFRQATNHNLVYGSFLGWVLTPILYGSRALLLWRYRRTQRFKSEVHDGGVVPTTRRSKMSNRRPDLTAKDSQAGSRARGLEKAAHGIKKMEKQLERAEVEIMPTAKPARRAKAGQMVDVGAI